MKKQSSLGLKFEFECPSENISIIYRALTFMEGYFKVAALKSTPNAALFSASVELPAKIKRHLHREEFPRSLRSTVVIYSSEYNFIQKSLLMFSEVCLLPSENSEEAQRKLEKSTGFALVEACEEALVPYNAAKQKPKEYIDKSIPELEALVKACEESLSLNKTKKVINPTTRGEKYRQYLNKSIPELELIVAEGNEEAALAIYIKKYFDAYNRKIAAEQFASTVDIDDEEAERKCSEQVACAIDVLENAKESFSEKAQEHAAYLPGYRDAILAIAAQCCVKMKSVGDKIAELKREINSIDRNLAREERFAIIDRDVPELWNDNVKLLYAQLDAKQEQLDKLTKPEEYNQFRILGELFRNAIENINKTLLLKKQAELNAIIAKIKAELEANTVCLCNDVYNGKYDRFVNVSHDVKISEIKDLIKCGLKKVIEEAKKCDYPFSIANARFGDVVRNYNYCGIQFASNDTAVERLIDNYVNVLKKTPGRFTEGEKNNNELMAKIRAAIAKKFFSHCIAFNPKAVNGSVRGTFLVDFGAGEETIMDVTIPRTILYAMKNNNVIVEEIGDGIGFSITYYYADMYCESATNTVKTIGEPKIVSKVNVVFHKEEKTFTLSDEITNRQMILSANTLIPPDKGGYLSPETLIQSIIGLMLYGQLKSYNGVDSDIELTVPVKIIKTKAQKAAEAAATADVADTPLTIDDNDDIVIEDMLYGQLKSCNDIDTDIELTVSLNL